MPVAERFAQHTAVATKEDWQAFEARQHDAKIAITTR